MPWFTRLFRNWGANPRVLRTLTDEGPNGCGLPSGNDSCDVQLYGYMFLKEDDFIFKTKRTHFTFSPQTDRFLNGFRRDRYRSEAYD